MAGTVPPPSERRRETFDQWYSFLEDECQKDNGLLCFYDRHKSREVAYFCGLLADFLTSSAKESEGEDLAKFFDMGTIQTRGRVPSSR
jgi:hypothetical protein